MNSEYSLGELMIASIARTIEDETLAFHGFGSPLVQLALHVARRTHAPNLVLVAGATYGINPTPPFLTPTSNDWVMDRGAVCSLDIAELFDIAAAGRMDRMFLSGLQIDQWGNCNVTKMGSSEIKLKLPGGGGGCNLSCDVTNLTLWTGAHRTKPDAQGRVRYRLVEQCDFITNLGHRSVDGRTRADLGHRGNGPQWLVTDLGVFGFESEGRATLRYLHPHVSVEEVEESTGFAVQLSDDLETTPAPDAEVCAIIRELDPLAIHERELSPGDAARRLAR
uniref:3-oxoadipate CoA-transferase subunit B n=1 Tax=Haliea sp. ETY-M TaxID=1055105 RepID=A0A455R068_9GAMM|nr:3-oxoadipate CoA-transferase subunit B [Haliea sp. ETY-M]